MELILWRHAEAAPGDPDSERPLTDRGRTQAALVANWLVRRLPPELRVVVSPARRTQETARALGRPFETVEKLAPGNDSRALLAVAGWPGAERPVLIIGHQPTLGDLGSRLLEGRRRATGMGTGAVWWLREKAGGGRSEAELLLALEPEILERGD